MNVQMNSYNMVDVTPFSYDTMANASGNLLEAINKSISYAEKIYGTNFESLFFYDDNQYPVEDVALYPKEKQIISVQFKNGTFFPIGKILLRTTDWKLKNSDEISTEINRLIDNDPRYDQLPELESDDKNQLPELEYVM